MAEYTKNTNIVLIGMPGAGKSTIGVILAKQLAKEFFDTDVAIQTEQNRSLQEILEGEGYLALRQIEEKTIVSLRLYNCVLATGGSAAYSEKAMNHLKTNGIFLYLEVDVYTLLNRIHDMETRGIACKPGQTFLDLYDERTPLYEKYATVKITCGSFSHDQVAALICKELKNLGYPFGSQP